MKRTLAERLDGRDENNVTIRRVLCFGTFRNRVLGMAESYDLKTGEVQFWDGSRGYLDENDVFHKGSPCKPYLQ